MKQAVLSLLLAVALLGCGSVSSFQRVEIPDLGTDVHPEMTRVFVIRSDQFMGSARPLIVYDSQREIGHLAAGHYLVWDHPTSRRLLRFVFDRPDHDGGGLETLVDHDPRGGQAVYYQVELRYNAPQNETGGGPGAPIAKRLDRSEGERLVERAGLASFEQPN